ncbi:MAG TPA: EAL domain-containing protein [Kineosporiaceae bacterium]|nr:EAL domain-containing protein [Kineosporiaceae bacterium]
MTVTSVTGLPVAAWAVLELGPLPAGPQMWVVVVLGAGVVLGELFPIEIARQGRRSDEVTMSTTLALSLLLTAPLGWALLAQSIPLVIDDLRRGKDWTRPVFNIAQYALTFAASRGVFAVLTGGLFWAPTSMNAGQLPAAFAAAAVFFAVNQLLVGTAVALWSGQSVLAHLREDGWFQLATSGLLVCLAPVVVAVSQFSVALVPLLFLPLVAVRNSARMAVQRQHDALHDALTGLPNRALLRHELDRRLAETSSAGSGVAVLLLDLDHFKEINDTLGHLAGDRLIVEVADRLTAGAPVAVSVGRLGGDEFAVVAALVDDQQRWPQQITDLVEGMQAALEQTVVLGEVRLAVSASIGVAVAPWHGLTMDDLLARADVAMYCAKKDRSGWSLYDPGQDTHSPERLALLSQLRDGIEQDQLLLVYQPKCETLTGGLHSVEALVRWQHPTRGLLTPNHFIAIAESTGLIAQLTLAVLDKAIAQARAWLDAGRPVPVAVNLSARHLTDNHLPEQVHELLLRHGLPGSLLTLEVTESTIMNDPTRAVAILAELRALGVGLAVDDYGTGYSSLTYLRQLGADELKIDRSFISALAANPDTRDNGESDNVIVRSTIELGRSLGMTVVAEGVEDQATWNLLADLRCDLIQGYVLTRPISADHFDDWLIDWQARSSRTAAVPTPRHPDPSSATPSPRAVGVNAAC